MSDRAEEWHRSPVNDSGETLDLTDWKTAAADVAELVDGFVGNAALASANFASCHNCGESGHFIRDCPLPRESKGACFNCNEEGHSKADCPNPRVFSGTCRTCSKVGHRAFECPDKPLEACKNCKQDGHETIDCTNNRVRDFDGEAADSTDNAWKACIEADQKKDLALMRKAVEQYQRALLMDHTASGAPTYQVLEQSFRALNFNTYLIALTRNIAETQTIMDFNGKLNCTYVLSFHFSSKPSRRRMCAQWPSTPEENLERLLDCGGVVDRGIKFCDNCKTLGHESRACKEEKVEHDRVVVKCVYCDKVGHRARDCPDPRVDKFACRNCKQSGHKAFECTEPQPAYGVECRRCNEVGHYAKDCPNGGGDFACRNCGEDGHKAKDCENLRVIVCRNCDGVGHMSKECPKPRDYSRVKCSNCNEMGHTVVRCKKAPVDMGDFENPNAGNGDGFTVANASSWDAPSANAGDWGTPAAHGGDWNTPATEDTSYRDSSW